MRERGPSEPASSKTSLAAATSLRRIGYFDLTHGFEIEQLFATTGTHVDFNSRYDDAAVIQLDIHYTTFHSSSMTGWTPADVRLEFVHDSTSSQSVGQVEERDLPPVDTSSRSAGVAALHLPYMGSSRCL